MNYYSKELEVLRSYHIIVTYKRKPTFVVNFDNLRSKSYVKIPKDMIVFYP